MSPSRHISSLSVTGAKRHPTDKSRSARERNLKWLNNLKTTKGRRFGDKFIAFANKVSDVSGLAAAYMLVPLVVVFLIEIILRNVFNSPTTWAYGMCFIIGGCAAVLWLWLRDEERSDGQNRRVLLKAPGKGALYT